LAATLTGEDIYRETALPGAVLARVAQSHLRVGTFQVFAHRGQNAELSQLTQYAIDRHDPGAKTPMDLLRAVCARQADLVAAWMSVGFIHGVMNTDNCTISGETIDYGPCAFIDDYHEDTVFSSIDRTGRYAYSNQRHVIVWNMAQFATALLQQLDDPAAGVEEATAIIDAMPGQIDAAWLARFGAKVGLTSPGPDDATLIQDLLTLMQNDGADFTNTFDALARGDARDQFVNRARFDRWSIRWQDRLCDEPAPQNTMQAASPRVIPRNHRIEDMIAAAVAGDFAPFDRLMTALADPYGTDDLDLMHPPTKAQRVPATFCGT
ncbi:protein adenylyltransferase SelO family protein, partial [Roseobacter sp.]